MSQSPHVKKLVVVGIAVILLFNPLLPLPAIAADSTNTYQSIDVCFITFDQQEHVLNTLPANTNIGIKLYTNPVHLEEGKVNSYGTEYVDIYQQSESVNRDLLENDGVKDSYCVKQKFNNKVNHEYTYSPATITSSLDWLPVRYNDQNNIDFIDLDIAFPYSDEWFDSVPGNESKRNENSDGHMIINVQRSQRRLVVVSQLDNNLPDYAVKFTDAAPSESEYTLSTLPRTLMTQSVMNLRLGVQNMGKLLWKPGDSPGVNTPVNISYHWRRGDGTYEIFDGRRGVLNHTVGYTQNDNVVLPVETPAIPGNYELVIDLVREGVVWFSAQGADTFDLPITVVNMQPVASGDISVPNDGGLINPTVVPNSYYKVQDPRPWDLNWRCFGYDCYSAIAEEAYHCAANGIPNQRINTLDERDLLGQCWYPIYAANKYLYQGVPLPPWARLQPWNYLQAGWIIYIPPFGFQYSSNFNGIAGASSNNPYAGMNGQYSAWPKVTFDRFIAWNGSYKFDQTKWSETIRPPAPTITGVQTNGSGTAVTIYGVGIPKGHPMHVAVWNEFRYCWACGSGWMYHYQLGQAQHVKIVLFKNNWQYLGEVWNDRADGRWSIALPLNANLKTGDRIFAEAQVEGDYTFRDLKWWSDTYETVTFDLRNPKYFTYPYFASGGGNSVAVPKVYIDQRSYEERQIDLMATIFGSSGASLFTKICGLPAKTYSRLAFNQRGAIFFVNGRAIYSIGEVWSLFSSTSDKCERFGGPINSSYAGATSHFGTTGSYQDFQKGRIYASTKYGGKLVHGEIYKKFESAGGTNSKLGWPLDEVHSFDDRANGYTSNCQNFEGSMLCDHNGTIYKGIDYTRSDKTLDYMFSELHDNARSITVEQIRFYNDCFHKPGNNLACLLVSDPDIKASSLWLLQVCQSVCPWDHKPKLRALLNLDPDGVPGNSDDDYYFPLSVNTQYEFYYDIWSNVHYGYVGMAAGFTVQELMDGANMGGPAGSNDAVDDLSAQIGIDLWNHFGYDLTQPQLSQAILSRVPDFEILRDTGEGVPIILVANFNGR